MKFVDAIYTSEKMIGRLWIVITVMGLVSAILTGLTVYFATKPALLIERSCESKVLTSVDGKRTANEVKAFIAEALSARFDSDRVKPSLMTEAQADLKSKEMRELKDRKIQQKIMVDEMNLGQAGNFTAKLTRILKIENLRTAVGFSIEAKIFEDTRTEDNPYGLILSEVKLHQVEVKK